jgi:hypothetical protein
MMHGSLLYNNRPSCLATSSPIELGITVIALTARPLETGIQDHSQTRSLANDLF